MELNESQRKAVNIIDKNVAVNAGAGSGKTKVLVERYINILQNGKLKEGKEVESIVAITFTKKASLEMKQRIRKSLIPKFKQDNKWKRMYNDLEKANISTIHSFCSKILKNNSIEAKINPNFKILEDFEADELLSKVVKQSIVKGIEKDIFIYKFVKNFSGYRLDTIVSDIMNIYKKIRSTGISIKKIKNITLNNINNLRIEWGLIQKIKDDFSYLMNKATKNSKFYKLKNNSTWIHFNQKQEFDDSILNDLIYLKNNIGTMKNEKERIDNLKGSINSVLTIKEKQKKDIYLAFFKLLVDIDEKYLYEKNKISMLDYDDLQIEVLKLLENDFVRRKYQQKFRYIMVDEFQDTNELQKKIVYRLCSENSKLDKQNLFIVGDPKQSIYGFRGADIDVFYDVMKDIKQISNTEPIVFKENYRTVDKILEFVNSMFENIMGDKYKELVGNKKSLKNVEILEKEDIEIPNEVTKAEYNKYCESRLIAKKIKYLVEKEQYKYKDIALLFRSSVDDYIYEEALKEYEIPYYNLSGKGFYNKQEIIDLINVLKALNNRYDTLSFLGVLRSPMFGISDESIYWILRFMKNNVLDTLKKDIPYVSKQENKKIKNAYDIMFTLSIKKNILGIYDLMKELISRTYYIECLLSNFGGKQAVANVYKFLDITRKFSEQESNCIVDFIDYIEQLRSNKVDESEAKVESQEGNTVKLMTIHKSKGLEFKVVIIPQMSKKFNNNSSSIMFDKNVGIGIKHKDVFPIYSKIKTILTQKEREENKRILYVAMTRAEERLILGNQGSSKESFKSFIKDYLPIVKYDIVQDLKIEKRLIKEAKDLNVDFKNEESFNKNVIPVFKDFKGFNQRKFKSFSITQYSNFKECKRKFYMTYYKKLPIIKDKNVCQIDKGEDILSSNIKGNIVHEFCENYRKNSNIKVLLKKIVKSYGINFNERMMKEIEGYINIYLKYYNEHYAKNDKIFSEKSFYYKIKDTFFYGIIDRINIKDGKAEIIDFKTNKVINKKKLLNKYEPQLQLYTKAFEDIYKIKVESASIFLLETGEFLKANIGREYLEERLNDLYKFSQFVSNNGDIESYPKNEKCNSYCNFNFICNKNKEVVSYGV